VNAPFSIDPIEIVVFIYCQDKIQEICVVKENHSVPILIASITYCAFHLQHILINFLLAILSILCATVGAIEFAEKLFSCYKK